MNWSETIMGGVQGSMAGAATGASFGGLYGAIIGAVIGGVAGHIQGYYAGEAKDKAAAKQKNAIEQQGRINETQARRQARQMTEAAMSKPTATSDTLFRETQLQREVSPSGRAQIADRGNPFHSTEDRTDKRVPVAPQFYGQVA